MGYDRNSAPPMPQQERDRPPQATPPGNQPPASRPPAPAQAPSWAPPQYQPGGMPANGGQGPNQHWWGGQWRGDWRDPRSGTPAERWAMKQRWLRSQGHHGHYHDSWRHGHGYGHGPQAGRPMWGHGPMGRGMQLHPHWMDRVSSIRYAGLPYRGAPHYVRYDGHHMLYRGHNGKWFRVRRGQRGWIPPRAWGMSGGVGAMMGRMQHPPRWGW